MIDIFGCLLTNQIMSRSGVENFTQIVFVEPIKEDERANPVSFHPLLLFIPVLPEYPVVLNRWGRQLNGTTLGPKEEVIA